MLQCSITFRQTNAGALHKILASICQYDMCLRPNKIRRRDVEECQIHETWYLGQSKLDLLVHATGSAVCIHQTGCGRRKVHDWAEGDCVRLGWCLNFSRGKAIIYESARADVESL